MLTAPASDTALCESGVYCNGSCLLSGEEEAGCTARHVGIGQAAQIAMDEERIYYSAANNELLSVARAAGEPESLVTGLSLIDVLEVLGDSLVYGTVAPDTLFEYHLRSMPKTGGQQTVLTELQSAPISWLLPRGEELLLGIGQSELAVSSIPRTGGHTTQLIDLNARTLISDETSLFYTQSFGELFSSEVNDLERVTAYRGVTVDARLAESGDYLYVINDAFPIGDDRRVYYRIAKAAGQPEEIQEVEAGLSLNRGIPGGMLVTLTDSATNTTTLSFLPTEGGELEQLAVVEAGELRDVVADDKTIYVAVGVARVGGILEIAR